MLLEQPIASNVACNRQKGATLDATSCGGQERKVVQSFVQLLGAESRMQVK